MHTSALSVHHHQRLLAAAALWLAAGSALLLSTAIPLHNELLGWAPAFWLLAAPLLVLLVLEPTLPRQLMVAGRLRRRRSPSAQARWH